MKEALSISRTDQGDLELDFEHLRNVGLEHIQNLSGSIWTDYNIHDPGITILEQLCYAITELGYKTAFDIKDLLASQDCDSTKFSTFYSNGQILEGKPITEKDFRKFLIDRVEGLRDAWVEAIDPNSVLNQIKGLYVVLVKPAPKVNNEKLLAETRKCLEKISNLGEAFHDILILGKEEVLVSGEIDLKKEANVDRTHAEVLFNIKRLKQ